MKILSAAFLLGTFAEVHSQPEIIQLADIGNYTLGGNSVGTVSVDPKYFLANSYLDLERSAITASKTVVFNVKSGGSQELSFDEDGVSLFGPHAIDDQTIVLGAPTAKTSNPLTTGRVFIFEPDLASHWAKTYELLPAVNSFTAFAGAVTIHENRVAVQAGEVDPTNKNGVKFCVVFVFDRSDDGSWSQTAKLEAGIKERARGYGCSLALYGNRIFVGSTAVDIFEQDLSTKVWSHSKISLEGTSSLNVVVAAWEKRLVVGTPVNQKSGVQVFELENDTWTKKTEFPFIATLFGYTLAVRGDTIAIGSPRETNNLGGKDAGVVHIYSKDGSGDWFESKSFMGVAQSTVGATVSMSSGVIGFSAYWGGSGYIFDIDNNIGVKSEGPPAQILVVIDRSYQMQAKTYVSQGVSFMEDVIKNFDYESYSISVGVLDLVHYSEKWLVRFDEAAARYQNFLLTRLAASKTNTIFGGTIYAPLLDKYADMVASAGSKNWIVLVSDGQGAENYKTLAKKKKAMKARLGSSAPGIICYRTRVHRYGNTILKNICDRIYYAGLSKDVAGSVSSLLLPSIGPILK